MFCGRVEYFDKTKMNKFYYLYDKDYKKNWNYILKRVETRANNLKIKHYKL